MTLTENAFPVTSQAMLRAKFWAAHPQWTRCVKKSQNDYPADIRMAWCDFVEQMNQDGQISEKLTYNATL